MMGAHHVVAHLMLFQAAIWGLEETMFQLRYMVRVRLGEYEWNEAVFCID